MAGGSLANWSKVPAEVRLPPFHRDRDTSFADGYISKRWVLDPSERHSWVVKLAKGF